VRAQNTILSSSSESDSNSNSDSEQSRDYENRPTKTAEIVLHELDSREYIQKNETSINDNILVSDSPSSEFSSTNTNNQRKTSECEQGQTVEDNQSDFGTLEPPVTDVPLTALSQALNLNLVSEQSDCSEKDTTAMENKTSLPEIQPNTDGYELQPIEPIESQNEGTMSTGSRRSSSMSLPKDSAIDGYSSTEDVFHSSEVISKPKDSVGNLVDSVLVDIAKKEEMEMSSSLKGCAIGDTVFVYGTKYIVKHAAVFV